MVDQSQIIVMWNASAGATEGAAEVRHRLEMMPNVDIREPEGRDAAIEETLTCAEGNAGVIVAAGGDGTVSAVVEGLARSERRPVLGILPFGTGKDLARTLKIPLAPKEAFETLRTGGAADLDVVRLSSSSTTRWFANMLTGGNTGRYLNQMTDELKDRWGPFCYLRGALDIIQDLQVFQVELTCDDGPIHRYDALNVFVANGRTSGGGLTVSAEAASDDGELDIVVIRDGDPVDLAGLTADYLFADFLQHERVGFHRAKRLTLHSLPAMPLTTDGDQAGATPATAEVHPRQLRVIVPGEAA